MAHEVAAGQPAPVQQALSMYLSLIPSAVRQSLKRPDDPMDAQGNVHVSALPGLGQDINWDYIRSETVRT